ncbi:MAG: 2Fe-2S iron-sulfur cluster binding domain-containing protein [Synergistaceae bacterium]|nr:2Fe-2S iron-sulfur cluster binding domain-containing protein [Synergistaceae bacterium]
MRIEMTINGALYYADVPPMKPLLSVLREDLGFKGSKEGCGEGECGACSVIIDGKLVNACLVTAVQASGREILTIEGLGIGSPDDMDMLQRAFVSEGGVQCGFCTPGMVIAARALLEENPTPTRDEIKVALSGNICRCTGYEKIYNAVEKSVQDGYCDTFKIRQNFCSGQIPTPTSESDRRCFTPENLNEVFEILDNNSDVSILAGSTDIIPDIKNGKYSFDKIMDLSRVKELRGINKVGDTIRIGSCVTSGDIIRSNIIRKYLPALWEAAFRSGAPAVQNRATIGGNLSTASGAADLPTILLPLDAGIVTEGSGGVREMKLEKFIIGYRQPDLKPNEIMREIVIPLPKEKSVQRFYKRGSRKALTLSRISLGFYAEIENGIIWEVRAAAGSMSPIPIRLKGLESKLRMKRLTEELIEDAAKAAYDEVDPRKSPEWRKRMTSNLVKSFLKELYQ